MAKAKDEKRVRITFRACLAGSGFVWNVGDVATLPEDEAARLVAAGFAAPADEAEKVSPAPAAPTGRRGRPAREQAPTPAATPTTGSPADPPMA